MNHPVEQIRSFCEQVREKAGSPHEYAVARAAGAPIVMSGIFGVAYTF